MMNGISFEETVQAMVRVCNKRFFRMVCSGESTDEARSIILKNLKGLKMTWRHSPAMIKEIDKLYEDWRTAPPGMSGRKEMLVVE